MARSLFEEWMRAVDGALKPLGFVRKSSNFHHKRAREQVIVWFEQLRKLSTPDAIVVRGGAQITNEAIAGFLGERGPGAFPPHGEVFANFEDFLGLTQEAQWIVRRTADALMPELHPTSFAGAGSAEEVAAMIARLVEERVLPSAARLVTSEALRDAGLVGAEFSPRGPWGGANYRLLMAILTALIGPADAFSRWYDVLRTEYGEGHRYYGPVLAKLRETAASRGGA